MIYNRVKYSLLFFSSLIFGFLITAFKGNYFNQTLTINIILSAASSFFLFFGILFLIPIIRKNPSYKNLIQSTCMMAIIAIAFEIEQYISIHTFSFIDFLVIPFASITFLMLHKNKEHKITSIDQQ
jgi:hypothetical protein